MRPAPSGTYPVSRLPGSCQKSGLEPHFCTGHQHGWQPDWCCACPFCRYSLHNRRAIGRTPQMAETPHLRHSGLVRVTHWLITFAFLALLVSGLEIVVSHPRFYWGETGNVNTPPLFKIPI